MLLAPQLCSADPDLAGSPAALAYLASQYPLPRFPIPNDYKTYDPTRLEKLDDGIARYEYNFHKHLLKFLEALDFYAATEAVGMTKLCAQLSTSVDRGKAEKMPLSFSGGSLD